MRIWGKLYKENRLIQDAVVELTGPETRTAKVFRGLEQLCLNFDLPVPSWLDTNIREFKKLAKTRFRQDSFIEEIPFDYFEFHVIEEDPGRFGA